MYDSIYEAALCSCVTVSNSHIWSISYKQSVKKNTIDHDAASCLFPNIYVFVDVCYYVSGFKKKVLDNPQIIIIFVHLNGVRQIVYNSRFILHCTVF